MPGARNRAGSWLHKMSLHSVYAPKRQSSKLDCAAGESRHKAVVVSKANEAASNKQAISVALRVFARIASNEQAFLSRFLCARPFPAAQSSTGPGCGERVTGRGQERREAKEEQSA
jgi:hypothetical protein